jgi:hypothetical protein
VSLLHHVPIMRTGNIYAEGPLPPSPLPTLRWKGGGFYNCLFEVCYTIIILLLLIIIIMLLLNLMILLCPSASSLQGKCITYILHIKMIINVAGIASPRMSLKGLYGEIRMNWMWYNWITNKKRKQNFPHI